MNLMLYFLPGDKQSLQTAGQRFRVILNLTETRDCSRFLFYVAIQRQRCDKNYLAFTRA